MRLDKILPNFPPHLSDYQYIAGGDETGRGTGAGPVVTASVILPKDFESNLLRDSKKLSEKQRIQAYDLIMENALSISCTSSSAREIDSIGLNSAIFNSFRTTFNELSITPDIILLDGNVWDNIGNYNIHLVTKGDDTYANIAASAIIGKVRRDEYMIKLDEVHPEYDFKNNKGYLTPKHIEAIKKYGITSYHRKSFLKNII